MNLLANVFAAGFVVSVGFLASGVLVRAWRWLRQTSRIYRLEQGMDALDRENQRLAAQLMSARRWNVRNIADYDRHGGDAA